MILNIWTFPSVVLFSSFHFSGAQQWQEKKENMKEFEMQINPIDFAYEVCSHGKIGIPTHKVNDYFFQLIWKFRIEFTINLFVSLRSVLLITQGVDSDLISSQQSKGEKGRGVSSGKDSILEKPTDVSLSLE